jgi:hypothetical protein
MEPHWHDYLKTAKDKILSAQTYIDEISRYSTITDATEEQLLRLSEHCSKMSKTINVILTYEKETENV